MTDPVFNITDHPTLLLEVKAVQAKIGTDADGEFWDGSWKALLDYLDVKVSPIRWGVSVPGGPAATVAFEKKLGHPVANNREYFQATGNPSETLAADKAAGRRTLLSVKPEPGWRAGPSKSFLDRWAGYINKAGGGVDLFDWHEPENDGESPADYVSWSAATIAGLRQRLTVPDVRLGTCLMGWTANPASGRNPFDWIPPNAEVVAWDGYGSLPGANVDRNPPDVFDRAVAVNRKLGLPMVIAETSALVSRGRQPQWFADLVLYCQGIADVLTDVCAWSSRDQALNAASLIAYRQAFA